MTRKRFKRLGVGAVVGELVYARTVPDNHFLRHLERVINWSGFTERLIGLYVGQGEVGRPPYDPAVILKMLVLSYLYNLSERQTEVYVNDSFSAKCFLGLAVDEAAPDHSTLSTFKERIVVRGRERSLKELLQAIIAQALQHGVKFGTLQIVDSTHSVANVNVEKDERRQAPRGQAPRDGAAHWGVKHTRRYRDEHGQLQEQREYFYGYKLHTSLNAETQLITSVVVTAGNALDGKQLAELVNRDAEQALPLAT